MHGAEGASEVHMWSLSMEPAAYRPSGIKNLQLEPRLLQNLCTPSVNVSVDHLTNTTSHTTFTFHWKNCPRCNVSDLYSACARWNKVGTLNNLRFLVVFFRLCRQVPGLCLKLAKNDSFHIFTNSSLNTLWLDIALSEVLTELLNTTEKILTVLLNKQYRKI
jgi:hypothetical protein